ncbi:isoamylase early set domain-containing protein [Christiangramia echinicola]|uniref:Glycogen recognition site of AMP-activated protein kinase n=1 Tax=Christiangramia echinicola TaxID=279359 RepID=A0A1H1LLE4_9FLAO|nr:isoamylase early set domain-containing protein [Christiangramia echinicola]SDR75393.1 Glycogen recognition site of AMP-activated protein kinase [Christiangramia echinicola]
MSITKQYLKSKPECKITFCVPAKEAHKVEVAGDFNSWELSELKKYKNGNFKGQFNVPVDQKYQFRYIVDGQWINEAEADGYQWNDFAAAENSVLEV